MEVAHTGTGERHPSVQMHAAELIKFRDERQQIVFTLTTGERIQGSVRCFDDHAIHVVVQDQAGVTVFKHALAYYQIV